MSDCVSDAMRTKGHLDAQIWELSSYAKEIYTVEEFDENGKSNRRIVYL